MPRIVDRSLPDGAAGHATERGSTGLPGSSRSAFRTSRGFPGDPRSRATDRGASAPPSRYACLFERYAVAALAGAGHLSIG